MLFLQIPHIWRWCGVSVILSCAVVRITLQSFPKQYTYFAVLTIAVDV